jgi:hypothetical protein
MLKHMLELDDVDIDELEILQKLDEAYRNNWEWVEFTDNHGNSIKMHLHNLPFDPELWRQS